MPSLKPLSSHKLASAYIQNYLEHDGRALARDFFFVPESHQERWADWFDAIRHEKENDLPWNGRAAVTYQHFIISPDPRDEVELDVLKDVVEDWVSDNFVAEDGIGPYPMAIVYHDDNDNQIVHAHIIVNNTRPGSPRRLQINNEQQRRLGDSLQRIAFANGLSYFPAFDRQPDEHELDGRRVPSVKIGGIEEDPSTIERIPFREERLTRAETSLLDRGVIPWKQRLRDAIDVACARSTDIESYDLFLSSLGVTREPRDGGADDVYYVSDSPSRKTRGKSLGDLYTSGSIRSRVAQTSVDWSGREDRQVRLVRKAQNIMAQREALWKMYLLSEGISSMDSDSGHDERRMHDIARMEKVCNLEHIVSFEDFDAAARKHAALVADERDAGNNWSSHEHEERLAEILAAKRTAEEMGAFDGVPLSIESLHYRSRAEIDEMLREKLSSIPETDAVARMEIFRRIDSNRAAWIAERESEKASKDTAAQGAPAGSGGKPARAEQQRRAQGRKGKERT